MERPGWCRALGAIEGGQIAATHEDPNSEFFEIQVFLINLDMKFIIRIIFFLAVAGTNLFAESTLRLIILNPDDLAYSKAKISTKDDAYVKVIRQLCTEADEALQKGPYSVVNKKKAPPSGDLHDYMSIGPYWWPDTTRPDSLPYTRRDGEVNPERYLYDNMALDSLDSAVTILSLAYYFSGNEKYAEHASLLIRTWFLSEETRMNPHLNYGQAIRGIVEGRGIGIIDTRAFFRIAEAIGLIGASAHWSETDQMGMEKWFTEYLEWLLQSDFGIDERNHKNNHGTWYDVLVTSLATFTGQKEIVDEILSQVPQKRIAAQIDSEGKQAYELERTRAFHYSVMNLMGLFQLALIAEKTGKNLWTYPSTDTALLRKGLDYLIPYALREQKWPYKMIRGWEDDLQTISVLLRIAAKKYDHPAYEKMIEKLPDININSIQLRLLFPDTSL